MKGEHCANLVLIHLLHLLIINARYFVSFYFFPSKEDYFSFVAFLDISFLQSPSSSVLHMSFYLCSSLPPGQRRMDQPPE